MTASADRSMEAIVPVPASTASARDRNATVRAASSSDRIPATHAAPISPCECPITACGTTPTCCHTAARAIPTAHSTGCTTSTRSNHDSSSPLSTEPRSTSRYGASAAWHSASRASNTGVRPTKPAAIRADCAP
ncbi:hypothetical protein B0E53_06332 [Micromonospora sp. MH33]|nr:hypothetical protein B0E53_06332 [Micromonospora sp. MH33]